MSALPDYQVWGNSDTTVFLLHGLFGSKDYWRFHARRLVDQGYRVVAWDAPGYGSSPLPEVFTLPALAEVQARLIEAVGTTTNVVHGHSMGGQLTPKVYSLIPDRISALVIVATIGYFGNRTPEEQAAFIRERAEAAPGAATEKVVQDMFAPGAQGEEVELVRQTAGRTPPQAVQAALKAISSYPEAESVAAIKGIAVPTLLISGGVDKVGHTAGMRRVQAMIPGAELAVVEGSGHYPWAEKPAAFNGYLHPFLKRHAPVG
jgi:pimeloyl-ACP methyl ester carboxylesterase